MVSAAPVFDWNSYPQAPPTGGVTGQPTVDPSQLQQQPAAPAAAPAPATGGAQDPQAYFQSLFPPGSTLSPQMLLDKEADLKAHGITLIKNAAGQPGKISLPDGSAFDVIHGAGSGQNVAAFDKIAGPGGVPLGGGGSLGALGGGMGAFVSPIGQFTPPSAADALNSPGSQYSIDEAMRVMQNSAAAKGQLLNGRVLQGELGAIQNQAAGQYNDVYNRAANTFGINFGVQTRNQDAPFQKYSSLAGLGQGAAAAS